MSSRSITSLLALLRERQGCFISGEELSGQLGVSRTAVWKHVHQLQMEGYTIQGVPHQGYRLLGVPDRLFPDEIQAGLQTRTLGRRVVCFERVTSTNDHALELADRGFPEGTLVTAEEQTHGRGRLGRRWLSPARANLLFTLIFRPAWSSERASLITLLMAVAVAEAIRDHVQVLAEIKWPNDIVIAGAKVAGILTEMRGQADAVNYIIAGVGVNVNRAPVGPMLYPVMSLSQAVQGPVLRLPLLRCILEHAEDYYLRMLKDGPGPMLLAWENMSCMTNAQVRVTQGQAIVIGTALGVDENGALLLRLDNGLTRPITCGEVEILSPVQPLPAENLSVDAHRKSRLV